MLSTEAEYGCAQRSAPTSTRSARPVPNAGLSYFQTERSSYGFRTSLAGKTPQEFDNRSRRRRFHSSTNVTPVEKIWVMRDYTNFHSEGGSGGARRYLYIDGHVTGFE